MNTIRQELELLGPEAVRRGMVAFEHRGNLRYHEANGTCPEKVAGARPCCFLTHAIGRSGYVLCHGHEPRAYPTVEDHFEKWTWRSWGDSRKVLREECTVFLAEHGTAVEPSPRKTPRVLQVVALVCVLLLL